ncbi:uncharacterized protein LOC133793618 isoform X1 [Humulus lupulus]|uniref:uncharacterized protein LOC133793618 isoform X1 n=1 Tax=Humulus lupulus TaxID=3486 RepID=UPI002B40CB89|nr:uncharacterized protein LOC133793618 isoform X1 [Humulus lupulus]
MYFYDELHPFFDLDLIVVFMTAVIILIGIRRPKTSSKSDGNNSEPIYSHQEYAKLQNPQYQCSNITDKSDPEYWKSQIKVNRYKEQLLKWEGFHVDCFDIPMRYAPAHMISPALETTSLAKDAAIFALEKHNKYRLAPIIKLKRIVKANGMLVNGLWIYLTLEATNGYFYEAKVYLSPPKDRTLSNRLEFLRRAKHYPMTRTSSHRVKAMVDNIIHSLCFQLGLGDYFCI